MKISLVLLTKNERPGLEATYDRIPFGGFDEAFAVDGGSADGTLDFYAARGLRVLQQRSAGRGEAFRLAFDAVRGDAVVFYSPDGNEDPADLPRFRPLLEQGFDMVIGTRMVRGARNEEDDHWLRPRKWANNGFNLMANWTWNRGPFISDSINGFRGITVAAWRRLALDGPGYTIEYQSTIRAMKLGLRVAEFPTHEGARVGAGGSPSMTLGLQFLRLYARELRRGLAFGPREERGVVTPAPTRESR